MSLFKLTCHHDTAKKELNSQDEAWSLNLLLVLIDYGTLGIRIVFLEFSLDAECPLKHRVSLCLICMLMSQCGGRSSSSRE